MWNLCNWKGRKLPFLQPRQITFLNYEEWGTGEVHEICKVVQNSTKLVQTFLVWNLEFCAIGAGLMKWTRYIYLYTYKCNCNTQRFFWINILQCIIYITSLLLLKASLILLKAFETSLFRNSKLHKLIWRDVGLSLPLLLAYPMRITIASLMSTTFAIYLNKIYFHLILSFQKL